MKSALSVYLNVNQDEETNGIDRALYNTLATVPNHQQVSATHPLP